jgi:hypothetical protein
MKPVDHTGRRFGRLVALEIAYRRGAAAARKVYWRFRCDCGTEKAIAIATVVSGAVASCGCLHMERCKSGLNRVRHGDAKKGQVVRLHSLWRDMLKRCNPANNRFTIERYAARGIYVCGEWQNYLAFKEWALANGYAEHLSIDRIDNDGPYSPENCRWVEWQQQCRNRRNTRWIEVGGERKPLVAWLEQTGVGPSAFHARLKRGWPMEKALGI